MWEFLWVSTQLGMANFLFLVFLFCLGKPIRRWGYVNFVLCRSMRISVGNVHVAVAVCWRWWVGGESWRSVAVVLPFHGSQASQKIESCGSVNRWLGCYMLYLSFPDSGRHMATGHGKDGPFLHMCIICTPFSFPSIPTCPGILTFSFLFFSPLTSGLLGFNSRLGGSWYLNISESVQRYMYGGPFSCFLWLCGYGSWLFEALLNFLRLSRISFWPLVFRWER